MTKIERALAFAAKEFDRAIFSQHEAFRNQQILLRGQDPTRIEAILEEHLAVCAIHREKMLVEIEQQIRSLCAPTVH